MDEPDGQVGADGWIVLQDHGLVAAVVGGLDGDRGPSGPRPPRAPVALWGQVISTQSVHWSVTTTSNVRVLVFPEPSTARQVTTLVPMGNRLPLGGMQSRRTGEQSSAVRTA